MPQSGRRNKPMTLYDLIEAGPSLEADGLITIYNIETGEVVAQYEGLEIHEKLKLKLFVWTEVLTDYTNGIIFTLAKNVEEAREIIERDKEDWHNVSEIYEKEPEIVSSAKGFVLYGCA